MYTTTNYGFNIVEGTDIVNPLTQLNPNFTSLDTDLKAVSDATVDNSTCIKTGTVHAITRTNTDANVFRFTATGNWNTGDTMTVDGTLVSVYVSDGTSPSNNCFVINTEVLAAIQGTRVTLYVNSGDASTVSFDDTSVSYTATNVQAAIEEASTATGTEYSAGVNVKDKIDGKLDTFAFVSTYTKSAGVVGGSYPTTGPFLVQVKYSTQGCDSRIFYDTNMLNGIVAFNVDYCPCYQSGVITVEMFNYKDMAKEAVKLLNAQHKEVILL